MSKRRSLLAVRHCSRVSISARAAFALIAFLSVMPSAPAQDYPSKPVRVIAGAAAGGLIDLFARTFAQKLQERSGQPVLVENRSVATGTVGADSVAKSAPDGYMLLMGHPASMVILPMLNSQISYNPRKDFSPIALVGRASNLLLVSQSSPVASVQDLIALAQSKPGTLTYASQGLGSSAHMATEQFRLATRIDLVHVPYRGSSPAVTDLISGQVSMMIDTAPFTLGYVRAGTLRALAVTAPERVSVLPEVPTMAEAGVPGLQGGLWLALFAPANTPSNIIEHLNKEAREIFSLPEVREKFEAQGLVLPLGTSEDLANFLQAEHDRWGEVIHRANIKFPQ